MEAVFWENLECWCGDAGWLWRSGRDLNIYELLQTEPALLPPCFKLHTLSEIRDFLIFFFCCRIVLKLGWSWTHRLAVCFRASSRYGWLLGGVRQKLYQHKSAPVNIINSLPEITQPAFLFVSHWLECWEVSSNSPLGGGLQLWSVRSYALDGKVAIFSSQTCAMLKDFSVHFEWVERGWSWCADGGSPVKGHSAVFKASKLALACSSW